MTISGYEFKGPIVQFETEPHNCEHHYKELYGDEPVECPWCNTPHKWNDDCDELDNIDDTYQAVVDSRYKSGIEQVEIVMCNNCKGPIAVYVLCDKGATVFQPDRYPL